MIALVVSQTLTPLRSRLVLIGGVCVAFAAPALAQTPNPCAIYGSGYVAVVGGGGCELIGGRVRVEIHSPASPAANRPLPNTALGYAAQQPAGSLPAHMRGSIAGSTSESLSASWPDARQNNPRIR